MNHPLDCPICDQGGECDLQVPINGWEVWSREINFHNVMFVSDDRIRVWPLVVTEPDLLTTSFPVKGSFPSQQLWMLWCVCVCVGLWRTRI